MTTKEIQERAWRKDFDSKFKYFEIEAKFSGLIGRTGNDFTSEDIKDFISSTVENTLKADREELVEKIGKLKRGIGFRVFHGEIGETESQTINETLDSVLNLIKNNENNENN